MKYYHLRYTVALIRDIPLLCGLEPHLRMSIPYKWSWSCFSSHGSSTTAFGHFKDV